MIISLISYFCFRIVCGLLYYGVSFAADDLGGSMYRDFILSTLVSFPGASLCFFLSNRYVFTYFSYLNMTIILAKFIWCSSFSSSGGGGDGASS